LAVWAFDRLEAEPARVIPNASGPFWSPDGKWIGFFSADGTELKKVSVNGGPPVTVCRTNAPGRGGGWGPDNRIVFATTGVRASGLMSVGAGGGELQVLTTPDRDHGERGHLFPSVLPGGEVVFTITGRTFEDETQLAVLNLKTGARKT